MSLTQAEVKTAAMLATMALELEPVLELLGNMVLPDLEPTRHMLAATGETGLALANLMVQLDDALEIAYAKLTEVHAALRANDLVVVAMERS